MRRGEGAIGCWYDRELQAVHCIVFLVEFDDGIIPLLRSQLLGQKNATRTRFHSLQSGENPPMIDRRVALKSLNPPRRRTSTKGGHNAGSYRNDVAALVPSETNRTA